MNAMRPILLAALFALPLAAQTPNAESFMSAAKLKQLCADDTADNPVSPTFVCVGYIMGVVDTLASLKDLGSGGMPGRNAPRPRHHCYDRNRERLLAETERRRACQATRCRRCAGCRHR